MLVNIVLKWLNERGQEKFKSERKVKKFPFLGKESKNTAKRHCFKVIFSRIDFSKTIPPSASDAIKAVHVLKEYL